MSDPEPTADEASDATESDSLPDDVIDRAETLTRRARGAVDENERAAYLDERDELLTEHGYTARIRDGDTGETLVLYPTEWIESGTVRLDRISDTDRAVERSISGPGSDADWGEIEAHNRAVADRIRERHGDVHGETASAFADFMSNHYAKPIGMATPDEREEFRTEYFVRNAWPSDEQRRRIDETLRLLADAVERESTLEDG